MSSPVRAIIPIAGRGTRMGPLASVVPKSMFPLMDSQRRLRPILDYILCEAFAAGVTHVGIVVSSWQTSIVRRYLELTAGADVNNCDYRGEVTLIEQRSPNGLGGAVLAGESFVGEEPFMVLLGDHVHVEYPGAGPCASQIVHAFAENPGVAMVGMQCVPESELPQVGAASGTLVGGCVYRCTTLIEKPSAVVARRCLVTTGLPPNQYLAHSGIYVFGPEMFACLREVAGNVSSGQEICLTRAQAMLLESDPQGYFLYRVAGTAYDTGAPDKYRRVLSTFSSGQFPQMEPSNHG